MVIARFLFIFKLSEPNGTVTTYTYDAAGNRLTETVVSGGNTKITTYSYNEQNRLLAVETKVNGIVTETSSFTYDHNGSQLTETKTVYIDGIAQPSLITQNNYDELNQLIETITPEGNNIVHIYNGEGVRVAKAVNGVIRRYFYEGDKVVLEVDENNNQIARNVYGTNLLTRVVDGQTAYYMYNGHGDVTKLINPAGDTLASYYYDAFGKITEETGSIDNPFRYAGYQYDKETGTYYLMARMYNPETARFLQEDTYRGDVKDPLSLNLYTYTHNEPIMHDDPTGHWIHIAMGALVGAAINTAVTAYQDYKDDGKFNSGAKVYLASAAQGAIEGAVGAATGGAGLFARAAINGAAAFVGNAIGQKISKGTVNWKEARYAGITGGVLTIGGHYVGEAAKKSKVVKMFEAKVNKFASKKAAFAKEKAGIFKETLSSKLESTAIRAKEASAGLKFSIKEAEDFGKVRISADLEQTEVQRNFNSVMREAEENSKNAIVGNGTQGKAEAKLSDGRVMGTHRELTNKRIIDSHHIIQDAAVKDIEGYNYYDAPAIQLKGRSIGTEHYLANKVQRDAIGGGTYGSERRIAYRALRKAGLSVEDSKIAVRNADNYFMGELGWTVNTPTNIPKNRYKMK